jgi:signal peptidase II
LNIEGKEYIFIVTTKRARLYDTFAFLVVCIVIGLDQWTKSLVVQHLSPAGSNPPIPIVGDYLSIFYIQNSGSAFSLFANNSILLVVLIALAICVIGYLYARMINTASLAYKLIFGMIIGGAAGNLLDRAIHGGAVVDFIYFQIPQIGFHFAVFNLADASISVGVFLLFLYVLITSFRKTREPAEQGVSQDKAAPGKVGKRTSQGGTSFQPTRHDG